MLLRLWKDASVEERHPLGHNEDSVRATGAQTPTQECGCLLTCLGLSLAPCLSHLTHHTVSEPPDTSHGAEAAPQLPSWQCIQGGGVAVELRNFQFPAFSLFHLQHSFPHFLTVDKSKRRFHGT